MMTTGDVARYMGVPNHIVKKLVKTGILPITLKLPTGKWRFDEEEVRKVVEKNRKHIYFQGGKQNEE